MRIGGHVSTAGGLVTAFERAQAIGAECIQIFGGPPQQWRSVRVSDEDARAFRDRMAETGIQPVFIHAQYLINLASDDPALLARSKGALRSNLHLCAQIGAAGVIFHIGSHKGAGFDAVFAQVCDAIREALDESPPEARVVLENAAGQGGAVGATFTELGRIIAELKSDRVGVCMDTQHAHAMGYDMASPAGIDAAMAEFQREVGWDRLAAVHANDSKVPLGGARDRHENIGQGHIGLAGFEAIMAHQVFRDVPFLLEVPGIEGNGPDKPNVDALKAIRERLGVPAT